jgi:hypothetical protein
MIYSFILKPPQPSQLMQSFLFKSKQNVISLSLRKISTISTQSLPPSQPLRRPVEHSFLPKINSIFNSNFLFTSSNSQNQNVTYFRYLTTTTANRRQTYNDEKNSKENEQSEESSSSSSKTKKPPSKFKQFYSQYGPMFLVVHLTTVVMWIYGFFLISKQ